MDPEVSTARNAARASDVMFDDRELARRARTTLLAADCAVVSTVPGIGRRREQMRVGVIDDDGEPVLLLPDDSGAADAARAERLGSVLVEPALAAGVRLRLTGRLAIVAPPGRIGQRGANPLRASRRLRAGQRLARLRVEDVHVGCPCAHGPAREREYRLPVEAYAAARPDYLAAHAPRMAAHLSASHGDRLRHLAARISGQPESRLAAATVTGLSAAALVLRYVDCDGAHDMEIALRPPAASVEELASSLTAILRTASGWPAA